MLICHQCQAENPNSHRFCQACGASLTQVECLNCGAMVDCGAKSCPVCDAVIGRQLYAVISRSETAKANGSAAISSQSGQAVLHQSLVNESAKPLIALQPGDFLDGQQRYQVESIVQPAHSAPSAESPSAAANCVEAIIFDQRPLELSPVQILKSHISPLDKEAQVKLPKLAQSYFGLEVELAPATPSLHDAWQHDDTTVVLIEDRSQWMSLEERRQDTDIDPLLVLRWLLDSLQLWQVLGEWGCRQSLLDSANLCLDEDDCLCLRQVKSDVKPDVASSAPVSRPVSSTVPNPDSQPAASKVVPNQRDAAGLDLAALGQIWQVMVQPFGDTLPPSVYELCDQLIQHQIESLDAVRSQLSAIADTLQAAEASVAEELNQNLDFETVEYQPLHDPHDQTVPPSDSTAQSESDETSPDHPLFEDVPSNPTATPSSNAQFASDDDFYSTWDEGEDEDEDSPTVVLPMNLLWIEDGGRTDIGRRREHNEDAFSIQLDLNKAETATESTLHARGLYVICDGMGGHAGGEIASALAVDVLRNYFATHWQGSQLPSEQTVVDAIRQANQAIYEVNQQNERLGSGRMGTTLVMLLLQDTHAMVAHVGDSRLYRFSRRLGLQQLTTDHEVGQREIQRGVEAEIAYGRPDAYQLTQALGPRDDGFVVPSIDYIELSEDTLLLLCSDGLSDNDLLETYWHSHVEPLLNLNHNLDEGIKALIDLGNQHNGHDNITAIAVRVKVRPKADTFKMPR